MSANRFEADAATKQSRRIIDSLAFSLSRAAIAVPLLSSLKQEPVA